MNKSKAWVAASWVLPINSLAVTYKNLSKSADALIRLLRGARDKYALIRSKRDAKDAIALEGFDEALAKHKVSAEKLSLIEAYMRKRKRAGIFMFYLCLGILMMVTLALMPYGILSALLAMVACWTFSFTHAFRERQIKDRQLFSVHAYFQKYGYAHPLNWN